jgi:hypothetical protein
MTEGYGSLECKIILDIPIANHNRSQRIWIFPITTNKGLHNIVCVKNSSRRDPYYSYHETLIRFQDVPEIVRDKNKLIIPKSGNSKVVNSYREELIKR